MAAIGGQRVLVVGGSAGIGRAVAGAAAKAGARVTVASSVAANAEAAAQEIGYEAIGVCLDIADEAAVATFFATAEPFDHLVSTAGDWAGLGSGPLADVDLAAAADLFRVRFWGALILAKHGVARLAPNGSLTFTDGTLAHKPAKGAYVASAMTGAIEHLTRALAVEAAPRRVNCVCPGLIRTRAWDRVPVGEREAMFADRTKTQLIARIGEPDEVAEAYLYLMRATYTTGQVIMVEGGSLLGR